MCALYNNIKQKYIWKNINNKYVKYTMYNICVNNINAKNGIACLKYSNSINKNIACKCTV